MLLTRNQLDILIQRWFVRVKTTDLGMLLLVLHTFTDGTLNCIKMANGFLKPQLQRLTLNYQMSFH